MNILRLEMEKFFVKRGGNHAGVPVVVAAGI